jgi:uroporphyrinogen-III synthase
MSGALAGFTVAVTADRRRAELPARLERHGARLVMAPALRILPVANESGLRTATRTLLRRPPDIVVADTGIGVRGWLSAAESWGLGDALQALLSATYLVAQGPRARRAVRAAGLVEAWSPPLESRTAVLDHLVHRASAGPAARAVNGSGALHGRRVAVQSHGEPQEEFCGALTGVGADVVEVPVYRWAPPVDPTPLERLVDLVTSHLVDAVAFTSAPAVESLLRAAGPQTAAVLEAFRGPVLAGCVGPVTAEPLRRHGVPALVAARPRLGGLAQALAEELPRRTRSLRVAGAELTLRGHAAVVDGTLKPLPPAQMAILRALAAAPGRVLPRAELLARLPRGADEHAVEMAVARLRAALGVPAVIQTVIKRGYRLRVD